MPRLTEDELQYVSKGTKSRLNTLAFGLALAKKTDYSISALRSKAVKDRLELARLILKSTEASLTLPAPSFRTAVSRAYYAMYHTARALVYFKHGGDDHQDHSKLPANLPDDFPSASRWENQLKQARYERNRADYDPYPKSDRRFESAAHDLIQSAQDLMPIARRYLRQKGWNP